MLPAPLQVPCFGHSGLDPRPVVPGRSPTRFRPAAGILQSRRTC
jgi:hypothetical protein